MEKKAILVFIVWHRSTPVEHQAQKARFSQKALCRHRGKKKGGGAVEIARWAQYGQAEVCVNKRGKKGGWDEMRRKCETGSTCIVAM